MSDAPAEKVSIPGRCLCGAVALSLTPPLLFASHCHCETCRRAHAAAFVTWTAVPRERFAWRRGREGVRWYRSSPGVERSFCGRCGTPLIYVGGASPDRVYVPCAVLDGPLDRGVDGHVSFEERVRWIEGVSALPCFRAKTEAPVAGDL